MAKREPEACMPCRGTGRVISNLGGERAEITCPWCRGAGARQPGIDAQAAWLEGEEGEERSSLPSDAVA